MILKSLMNSPIQFEERMGLAAVTDNRLYTEADFPNLKIALVHYWLVTFPDYGKI